MLKNKLNALEEVDSDIVTMVLEERVDAAMERASKYQLDIHLWIAKTVDALSEHHSPASSVNVRTNDKFSKVNIDASIGDGLSYPNH